jgi:hypothetical protein
MLVDFLVRPLGLVGFRRSRSRAAQNQPDRRRCDRRSAKDFSFHAIFLSRVLAKSRRQTEIRPLAAVKMSFATNSRDPFGGRGAERPDRREKQFFCLWAARSDLCVACAGGAAIPDLNHLIA